MVKVSARVVVSFSAPAEKLPLLDQFDAIIAREGTSDRSKTIMELIEAYVKRKAKTPNPQATLLVRPYPNIWSDEASTSRTSRPTSSGRWTTWPRRSSRSCRKNWLGGRV